MAVELVRVEGFGEIKIDLDHIERVCNGEDDPGSLWFLETTLALCKLLRREREATAKFSTTKGE